MTDTSKSVERALHIKPNVSREMINAIELWGNMYQNKSPWLREPTNDDPTRITSLGLPAFIAGEKARMATLEMRSEITSPTETVEQSDKATGLNISIQKTAGDTARADFLNEQYNKTILKDIRIQLEYGIAKGGLVIKPYVTENSIAIDYVQADNFYPIAFSESGRITEAVFIQKIINKDSIYSRLEYHKFKGRAVTIINKAFKAPNTTSNSSELGREIPLTDVAEWADLEPETTINNVDRLLFAYFKMPIANTIDTYSPLGVSGYSRAVSLIQDADEQYSRLLWEFEGSELAIDVDRDILRVESDENGNDITKRPQKQQRLFRMLDIGTSEGKSYQAFSPAIRDESLLSGLNYILMKIEDACELARGTLSNVNQEARTATEIAALKQRSYASNADIQKALEDTLKDVVYIMDVYTTLYELAPEGEYDISFEWDDSIKTDRESELSKRLTLMQNGLVSRIENRMWYFGETEEQAVHAIAKIQQENEYEMRSGIGEE